ncbi:U32 family peptidase [Paenibacillus sp. ACRRX]|uniref:U32 family peptidase n=1 Tax=Paenibacillus sp. ACRRX TaxID=2918206 RepID=UPI001EF46D22|nr:U32 family peptidase [Paenibacillus sp. ACRRX]MCG7407951.1 U32 family peptidase [Paenibacillus sp. ACRRX]
MTREIQREDIELLAPAGDWDCMRAAVANGADAIFFGVEKFNARARANNFRMDELPEIMAFLHSYGVKGFLTFNILVFEDELRDAQQLIDACIDAGVDAVIVQDLGLVKLIREMSPDFPIHGSTQMTITSPEAAEFTKPFGMERVVLGRENNLKQIQKIGEIAKVPMEVFVHGALCVSYSGQCLTSEMWGGRSANRGECAQACRLPYDMMVDGEHQPMGDITYLLSPKDLAAIDIVPELIEAGVTSFKIEGRMKQPEYVANVVSKYRKAIDDYFDGTWTGPSKEEVRELQQSFSRGFTHGFLSGTNNKQLVDGTFPKSRGVYLGRVEQVLRDGVVCKLEAPLKRGDGIGFDAGDPTQKEEGGRVYDVRRKGVKLEGEAEEGWIVDIVPGRNDVNLRRVKVGDRIWKTSDQALDKRMRATFETEKPYRVFPMHIRVEGRVGEPLKTWWTDVQKGTTIQVDSELLLEEAQKRPMDRELLEEQLGRLGGTVYQLEQLDAKLEGSVIVPMRELNAIRRRAVEHLAGERPKPPVYVKHDVDVLAGAGVQHTAVPFGGAQLTALCRTLEQVQAAVLTDVALIYADFEFIKQFPAAIEACRAAGKPIALVTPRIHMPNENGYHRNILNLKPDAVLIRNTGALHYYQQAKAEWELKRAEASAAVLPSDEIIAEAADNSNLAICPPKPMGDDSFPQLIGDFSLNVANHKTVQLFAEAGLDRITPSYDLNIQQMVDMLRHADTSKLEIVIHQHLPMFHTEHCVYCTFLSEGTDYTNCGRPCEEHNVSLRDRIGMSHPVRVDEGCRNTVYNAIEQSGSEYLPNFLELGVDSYRIEFLEETAEQVNQVIDLYNRSLCGEISGTQVWRMLKATNQLGVTRGQLVK